MRIGRGHAVAHQPPAVAHARRASAGRRSQPNRRAPSRMHSTRRRSLNGTPRLGMDRRLVQDAQLDRIHARASSASSSIADSTAQQARRLARRAHVLAARQVELAPAGAASAGWARRRGRARTSRVCSANSAQGAGVHGDVVAHARPAGRPAPRPGAPAGSVIGRQPMSWKICCRVSATLTGCSSSRAASAARIVSEWMPSLEPNPPPTKGVTMWIRSGSIWSVLAIAVRASPTICELT